MAGFFDKVTWPKVALVLGSIVLLIAARVLFPEEAQWMRTWVADLFAAGVDLLQGG